MKIFPILGISFAFAMLAASSVTPQVFGQSIGLSTIKTEIYPRGDIFVTGFVDTDSFYKTVTLTVYDPSGNMVYKPNVTYDDQGRFTWLFHPPIPQFETGVYTIVASHEDVSATAEIQFEVIPESTEQPTNPLNIESKQTEVQEHPSNEIQSTESNNPATRSQSSNNPIQAQSQEQSKDVDLKKTIEEAAGNEFVQSTEFAAIVGTTIAATVVGIILWLRTSYIKEHIHN